MKSILILGDCHSNGNNCFDYIIQNDPNIMSEWSLRSYGRYDKLIEWYEKNTTETVIDKTQLVKSALKYLTLREKSVAWPSHLQNDYNIFNRSVNGNHCGRYRIQLKDHIDKNDKPDLILITDYHWSHVFTEFTEDNQYHTFLSSTNTPQMEWTEDLGYSKKVLAKRKQEFIDDYSKGPNFLREKTNQHHDELIKDIKQANIPFAHCLFEPRMLNKVDNHIDLTRITLKYRPFWQTDLVGQNRSNRKKNIKKLREEGYHNDELNRYQPHSLNSESKPMAVNSQIKMKSQKEIADRVRPLIEDALVESA
tara:strand:+ start:1576 stop:2499 length:924 start_codon:yes stop_codon:yes gene_type:complete